MAHVQLLVQIGAPFGETEEQRHGCRAQQQPGRGRGRDQRTTQQHANDEARGQQEHVQQHDVFGAEAVGQVDGQVHHGDRDRRRSVGLPAEKKTGQHQHAELDAGGGRRDPAGGHRPQPLGRVQPVGRGVAPIVERVDGRVQEAKAGQPQRKCQLVEFGAGRQSEWHRQQDERVLDQCWGRASRMRSASMGRFSRGGLDRGLLWPFRAGVSRQASPSGCPHARRRAGNCTAEGAEGRRGKKLLCGPLRPPR